MLLKWVPRAAHRDECTRNAKTLILETPVLEMSVDKMKLPEKLDGFDLVDGLERMLGSPDIYLKFMLKLVEDHGDDARLVRESLASGDRDTAHRLAHTTKGVSGNLSALDLYAAATQLSDAIKRGDENLDEDLDTFESELNRAVAAIRSLCNG